MSSTESVQQLIPADILTQSTAAQDAKGRAPSEVPHPSTESPAALTKQRFEEVKSAIQPSASSSAHQLDSSAADLTQVRIHSPILNAKMQLKLNTKISHSTLMQTRRYYYVQENFELKNSENTS